MKSYEDLVQLLKQVQSTGILPKYENAVCEYQDMIGNSSIEQLAELAEGVYKATLYRVYDAAYGTIETLNFYFRNSEKINALRVENANLKADVERERSWAQHCEKEVEQAQTQAQTKIEALTNNNYKLSCEIAAAHKKVKEQEQEIIELKARLYDLISK